MSIAGFTDWATPAHVQQRLRQAAEFVQAVEATDPRLTVVARDVTPTGFRVAGWFASNPGDVASLTVFFEGGLYALGQPGIDLVGEMLLVALLDFERMLSESDSGAPPSER